MGAQNVLAATELGIAQVSPADHLMAVLMRATRVLGVVDMDRLQALETHNAVEFGHDAIQVIHDVIPTVGDVAGVQAHTEHIGARQARDGVKPHPR